MGVGDDEGDPGQPPGDEAAEERRPARSILGGDHVDAEDLAVAVGVHAGRDHRRDRDDPAALAHLVEERVEPEVGVGALIEGAVPELGHLLVEVLRELGDLGLAHPLDPHRAHEVVDAPGGHALDVGLADHRDERLLGAPAWFEEARQVGTFAQLRHLEADRAGPGVPAAHPVAVAAVQPVLGPLAVARVAEHVDVRVHEQLSCHLHHLSEQVGSSGALQVLAQQLGRAHRVGDGHRIFSF